MMKSGVLILLGKLNDAKTAFSGLRTTPRNDQLLLHKETRGKRKNFQNGFGAGL
jgi:hypothetical protein